jgi:hypothetical protein
MKKPTLRVTRWLGDIPAEAYCTACPRISFRAHRHVLSQADISCATDTGLRAA